VEWDVRPYTLTHCLQDDVQVSASYDGMAAGMVPLPSRRSSAGVTSPNGDMYLGTLSSQVISEEYTAVESYPVNCVAMYHYQVSYYIISSHSNVT